MLNVLHEGGKLMADNTGFRAPISNSLLAGSRIYDHMITTPLGQINSIDIKSDVVINIIEDSLSNEINIHLYGYAIVDGVLNLVVDVKDNHLTIVAKAERKGNKEPRVISDVSAGEKEGISLTIKMPKDANVCINK